MQNLDNVIQISSVESAVINGLTTITLIALCSDSSIWQKSGLAGQLASKKWECINNGRR